jgi:hypothetical protein
MEHQHTECKIYTSPSHNVIKYYIHIGPTAKKHLCIFFFNYCQVSFYVHGVKQGEREACVRFFFNNSFANSLRESF